MLPLFLMLAMPQVADVPVEADTRPVLWGDYREGMTKKEVKGLDKEEVQISQGCRAELNFTYEHKALSAVELSAGDSESSDCGTMIGRTLLVKYGDPLNTEVEIEQDSCGYGGLGALCHALGGDTPVEWHYKRWVTADGQDVVFRVNFNNTEQWAILYTRTVMPSSEAAAKL